MRQNTKIFVLTHKKTSYELPNNSLYTPLQVRAAGANEHICDLRDDLIDGNISKQNYFYLEFTGIYAICQMIKAGMYPDLEYVGQCHYRRLYPFKEDEDFSEIFK